MQHQFIPPETYEETTPTILPAAVPTAVAQEMETASTAGTLEVETAPTAAATQAVAELLARTRRRVHRRKQWYWASFAVFLGLLLLNCYFFCIPGYRGRHEIPHFTFILWLVSLFVNVLNIVLPMNFDVNALAQSGGKSAIPALLEYMIGNIYQMEDKICIAALATLLPQLQASDMHLLMPRHKRQLNRLLNPGPFANGWITGGEELIVPLLKAYEQVGNATDIPFVERLANRVPGSERGKRIQEAAQACLPLLRAHVGSLDGPQTLLRAAAPDTHTPDTLLRAATSSAPVPPAELLRAGGRQDVPPA